MLLSTTWSFPRCHIILRFPFESLPSDISSVYSLNSVHSRLCRSIGCCVRNLSCSWTSALTWSRSSPTISFTSACFQALRSRSNSMKKKVKMENDSVEAMNMAKAQGSLLAPRGMLLERKPTETTRSRKRIHRGRVRSLAMTTLYQKWSNEAKDIPSRIHTIIGAASPNNASK